MLQIFDSANAYSPLTRAYVVNLLKLYMDDRAMKQVSYPNLSNLTGQFEACNHIQLLIESGDLKSMDDLLSKVKSDKTTIESKLSQKKSGKILSIQESLERGYGK